MNKAFTAIGIFIILSLLIWNIVLVTNNSAIKKENSLLKTKFNVQQGEIDILTYDLVTTRDSLRIIISELDSIPQIQKEFY